MTWSRAPSMRRTPMKAAHAGNAFVARSHRHDRSKIILHAWSETPGKQRAAPQQALDSLLA